MKKKIEDKEFLTAKEAARYLGISLKTLYQNFQFIPNKRKGRRVLYRRVSLDVKKYAMDNPPIQKEQGGQ